MSDLQNQTPAATYKGLLQVNDYTNGVDATAKYIQDGEGTDSSLAISTGNVGIGTASPSSLLHLEKSVGSGDAEVLMLRNPLANAIGESVSVAFQGAVQVDMAKIEARTQGSNASGAPCDLVFQTASSGSTATDRMIIDNVGNVGIGTTSPTLPLEIQTNSGALYSSGVSGNLLRVRNMKEDTTSSHCGIDLSAGVATVSGDNPLVRIHAVRENNTDGKCSLTFQTRSTSTISEAMRIDSSGNVGIGTNSPSVKLDVQGDVTFNDPSASLTSLFSSDAGGVYLNLNANNGTHVISYEGGDLSITDSSVSTERLNINSSGNVLPGTDNTQDLGSAAKRWDVIYVKDTNITTSDREQKQDIEELTEAETRVAQACKGLLRKYRWKDQVAAKGDEARIHFGIIAQDLEDAFTAEGLDAGRYGMFVKNTWWTADRVIPAVEAVEAVDAVYDEEGNEVSPAVEAVEAQPERTVTDIFNNSEDAPEGATEVTQRGVRYSELLAFIISAI